MQNVRIRLEGRTGRIILLVPIIWRYHWHGLVYIRRFRCRIIFSL